MQRHLVAKFATNVSGAILLPSSIQVTESISGSVVPLAMFGFIESVHCREEGCIGKYTPREISQGPRPERLPEGEARGQSRGPRGAKSPHKGNLEGRGGCIFRYIPTRGSVRTFFHHYQGTIDFVA